MSTGRQRDSEMSDLDPHATDGEKATDETASSATPAPNHGAAYNPARYTHAPLITIDTSGTDNESSSADHDDNGEKQNSDPTSGDVPALNHQPSPETKPTLVPKERESYKDEKNFGEEDYPLETIAPPQWLQPSPALAFEDEVETLIVHFYNLQQPKSESKESQYRIVHHRPSVKRLLEFGPSACMNGLKKRDGTPIKTDNPELRWIHLPANNMSWVERLMIRIYFQKCLVDKSCKESAEVLLGPDYWINRRIETAGPATRHMRPIHAPIPTAGRNHYAPMNRVTFMPYIHWDLALKLQLRNECIKTASDGKQAPHRPSMDVLFNYSQEALHRVEKKRVDLKNAQADDSSTVFTRSKLEMKSLRRKHTAEELILLAYLNVESPIHPRRTLDHSRYHTLQGEDIGARDLDQVVYRHTMRKGLKPRLVMVDQLWLWMIDDNTVVTAFPRRWKDAYEPAFDRSDVQERIMMDLTSNVSKIKSCSEFVHLVIRKCSGTLFPCPNEVDPTGFLDFLQFFEIAIGDVKMKETRAFNKLLEHTNEMESLQAALRYRRDGKYPAISQSPENKISKQTKHHYLSSKEIEKGIQSEVSALTNITDETNLLKEIKDIQDELNSLILVFKQQELVVQAMDGEVDEDDIDDEDDYDGASTPEAGQKANIKLRITRSQNRLLRKIQGYKRDIELLDIEATKTHDALSMLLDLKQKQASVSEADYARQEAVETTYQGKSILIFTTVTIVFLPLSFIAGIFSMNANEINGYKRPIWQIMAVMMPVTLVVVTISLTLAYARNSGSGIQSVIAKVPSVFDKSPRGLIYKTMPNETAPNISNADGDDALAPDPGTEKTFVVDDNCFAFSPGQMGKLFEPRSLRAFYALGGINGLEKGLRTSVVCGLSVDENRLDGTVSFKEATQAPAELNSGSRVVSSSVATVTHNTYSTLDKFVDRRRIFGDNNLPEKKTSFFKHVWMSYNDKVLIILNVFAAASLALGLYQSYGKAHYYIKNISKTEWVEGLAVIIAIFIYVVLEALSNWHTERGFRELDFARNFRQVKVIRSGKSVEIPANNLLVGDVMHLAQGDVIPADGIFIQGDFLKCDESSLTGESDAMLKTAAAEVFRTLKTTNQNYIEKLDPFILAGSNVSEGTGIFLVTAVGGNTTYGKLMMALSTERPETRLRTKHIFLTDNIFKAGIVAASILFIVLTVKFGLHSKRSSATSLEKAQSFLHILIECVTLALLATPEVLPRVLTLAIAFATRWMMRENNLVQDIRACETIGHATTICSDKTGIITSSRMDVVAAVLGKSISFTTLQPVDLTSSTNLEESAWENTTTATNSIPILPVGDFVSSLSRHKKEFLTQAITINSTAFEDVRDDDWRRRGYIGSQTEAALLDFCRSRLGSRPLNEERSFANVVQMIHFDSEYMATIVKQPNGLFRAYIRGAPEVLLDKCRTLIRNLDDDHFTTGILTAEDRKIIEQIVTSYSLRSLRTVCLTYRDFSNWPPSNAVSEENPRLANFIDAPQDLTFIGLIGIQNPIRPGIIDAISNCQKAGVSIRLVTSDNIITSREVARDIGLYTIGGVAMEGHEFRNLSREEREKVVPKLQILARCRPEDKKLLVMTLEGLGETVAVTGGVIGDAWALKSADIGFSMGIGGTDYTRMVSSIILMDDCFASVFKGIMWGRAVNDNLTKFIQFQMTSKITAITVAFISAVAGANTEYALSAVQLLWIKLIIDVLAVLALVTDLPSKVAAIRKPQSKLTPLITISMTSMIIGQALYQLAVTIVLTFAGSSIFKYNHEKMGTIIFNTFVWLQIFNLLNNRRIDSHFNIFEGIFHNKFFIPISAVMVIGQILIIFFGGATFAVVRLSGLQWVVSIVPGILTLPVGVIIRLIPIHWIADVIIRSPWLFKLYFG